VAGYRQRIGPSLAAAITAVVELALLIAGDGGPIHGHRAVIGAISPTDQ